RLGIEALDPRDLDSRDLSPFTIDAGATPVSLDVAIRMTAEDGFCNSIGSLHAKSKIPTALMFGRNVTVHLGRSHAHDQIRPVLDLVTAGKLRPAEVTTTVASLDDAPRALREHVVGQ